MEGRGKTFFLPNCTTGRINIYLESWGQCGHVATHVAFASNSPGFESWSSWLGFFSRGLEGVHELTQLWMGTWPKLEKVKAAVHRTGHTIICYAFATETGECCFISPIDQLSLTGYFKLASAAVELQGLQLVANRYFLFQRFFKHILVKTGSFKM